MNLRQSHVSAGLTAIIIGYSSSAVLVTEMAQAIGLSSEQIASWLMVIALAMGVATIVLSIWQKVPVLVAWSTPGAAFLVTQASDYSTGEFVAAFLLCGALITLCGFLPIISKWIGKIPKELSAAMLAAIILPFCIEGVTQNQSSVIVLSGLALVFFLSKRFVPRFAMLLLLLSCIVLSWQSFPSLSSETSIVGGFSGGIMPELSWLSAINLALPLFVLTMLSQNLPGLMMVQSHGFKVSSSKVFQVTGLGTLTGAVFGVFSLNLAAISAAVCLSSEAGEQKEQRYFATVSAGVVYIAFGLFTPVVLLVLLNLPQNIIAALVLFALLATLAGAMQGAFNGTGHTESAAVTFIVTASGVQFLGVGSVVWGLLSGLLLYFCLGQSAKR